MTQDSGIYASFAARLLSGDNGGGGSFYGNAVLSDDSSDYFAGGTGDPGIFTSRGTDIFSCGTDQLSHERRVVIENGRIVENGDSVGFKNNRGCYFGTAADSETDLSGSGCPETNDSGNWRRRFQEWEICSAECLPEMVLGSAVLIKNCLGAAALIILLLAAAPPVIRLGVSSVFYRFIAALVRSVTEIGW